MTSAYGNNFNMRAEERAEKALMKPLHLDLMTRLEVREELDQTALTWRRLERAPRTGGWGRSGDRAGERRLVRR